VRTGISPLFRQIKPLPDNCESNHSNNTDACVCIQPYHMCVYIYLYICEPSLLYYLNTPCDLGQVTEMLCASVSLP
jgi:hypothetical protein